MKPSTSSNTGSGLVRALGPLVATAVVVGTVIGSGIFFKPATVARDLPSFGLVALVWILGGLLVLLGALAYAEVAVLYPRAGGNYVFLREAYGRLFGFLWGWVDFCIIRTASIAALATAFTGSLHDVLRDPAFQKAVGLPADFQLGFWTQRGLTIAVLFVLALVNCRGVKWGGVLQLFITLIKVGSLLAIVALPFIIASVWYPAAPSARPDPSRLRLLPEAGVAATIGGFGSALLAVQWAYHGWQNLTPVAEEVRSPQRNLPLALLVGVGIIIILYLGANLAYSLVLPHEDMAALSKHTETPVTTLFGQRLLGPLGTALASAVVMCSVFGALNGNLLVGPRLLYAMSEDGLAPRALGEIHPRYHTPALAILLLACWSSALIVIVSVLIQAEWITGKSPFDSLTDFAMFGALIFETLAVVSIFVFRRRYPDAERPYRCWGYPVVPALYVILPVFVLVNMFVFQRLEALSGLGFIMLGALVYLVLGLGRATAGGAA